MSYRCNTCSIDFKSEINLARHQLTDRHKKRLESSQTIYTCKCGKGYSHRPSYYRHRKGCTFVEMTEEVSSDSSNDEKDAQTAALTEANIVLSGRVDKLQAKLAQIMKAFEERTTVVSDDTTIELTHQESELSQLTMSTIEPPTTESESNELFPSPPKPQLQSQPPSYSQPPPPPLPLPPQSLQYRTRGHPPIQPSGVYVNPFRNENMDYVTDNVTIKCIKRLYQAVPTLIRKIHFDSKHPENHNLRITNRKYPHVSAMTANQTWKFEDKYHVIDLLMNKAFSILEYTFQDNKDEFSPSQRTTFEEFIRKYNSQDKSTLRTLRRNIDILLLNGC